MNKIIFDNGVFPNLWLFGFAKAQHVGSHQAECFEMLSSLTM
jgi:hypothetical protein